MDIVLHKISLLLYALGTVGFLLYLGRQREILARAAFWLTAGGFAALSLFLITRGVMAGHHPISNLFEALNFFAWSTVCSYFILQYRFRIKVLGALVMPIVLALMAFSLAQDKSIAPLIPALQSNWLGIHTTLAFLGNSFFAIAFAGSILYLIQERQLKKKNLGSLFQRLPSLDVLDRLHYRSLTIGFPLMTFGIITGAIWAASAWGSYWSWDPKETWSLITWFIYAALVHARMTIGWRGRKAAWLSILGFAAILFTFLGVNLILGGLHSYN
jgi:cytochrome c-type biogenesis protein CcsB